MSRSITAPAIGHNSAAVTVTIEARLFNSLSRFAPVGEPFRTLEFPAGSTVADVVSKLNLPIEDVYLVLRNGRDVTPGVLGDPVNTSAVLDDGDVIALSGPVPYSFGYGAPVV